MKLIISIFLIILTCSICRADGGEPKTDYDKLQYVISQMVTGEESPDEIRGAIPCDVLQAKYYQSGPAWHVSYEHGDLDVSPWDYKTSKFKPLYMQSFQPGEKRYFIPAFYADLRNELKSEEFVGFISFKVMQNIEKYNPKKHEKLNEKDEPTGNILLATGSLEPEVKGSDIAKPQIFTRVTSDDMTITLDEFVVTETCFDPQPHLPTEDIHEDTYSAFNNAPGNNPLGKYEYYENDPPTATMYRVFLNDLKNKEIDFLNKVETATNVALIFLRLPFASANLLLSAKDLYDCEKAGDSYCWAHFAFDAAGSAGVIFKITAKTAKSSTVFGKISKDSLGNALIYGSFAGNGSLAALHAQRGEIFESIGSVLSVGIDVSPLVIRQGRILLARLGRTGDKCNINPVTNAPNPIKLNVKNVNIARPRICEGNCYDNPLDETICHSKPSYFMGSVIKQSEMHVKPFEYNAAGKIIKHPAVTVLRPDESLLSLPDFDFNTNVMYVAVRDNSNPYGFKLKFAVEKPLGVYTYPDGTKVTATYGHPTMVDPEDEVLYAGEIILEPWDKRLKINNKSGRVSASPFKPKAGLEVVTEAVRRMIQDPKYNIVESEFLDISLGTKISNEGASRTSYEQLIKQIFTDIMDTNKVTCSIR